MEEKEKIVQENQAPQAEEVKTKQSEEETKESSEVKEGSKTKEDTKTQEQQEDSIEQEDEQTKPKEPQAQIKEAPAQKTNNHDILQEKLDSIKEEIADIYKEYQTTLQEFENLSAALASQENALINTTITTTQEFLGKLHAPNNHFDNTLAQIQLDNKKELLEVKKPSKGRFKGVFLGTAATLLTVAGLGAYGAKLANLPINLATFSQKSNIDTIVSKYLELMNLGHMDVLNGYLILGAGSLLVGFIVYKFITFTQKIKNKKYVEHLEEHAKEYKKELLEQIEELEKVIEHIKKIQELNEKYDILLQEQNAKLKRILFFEHPESFEELHTLSKAEVEKTQMLLEELIKLMNTPVLVDNKLSEESLRNFQSASVLLEETLKKLY